MQRLGGVLRRKAETAPRIRDVSIVAVLGLLSTLPILLVRLPGFIDLPWHVARWYLELNLAHLPALQPFYSFHWRLIPNLGCDLLIVPLAHLFGFWTGVRLLVAMVAALMVAGLLGLARACHRRLPATAFLVMPLAYASPMQFGFLNYCLGVAMACLVSAFWVVLTAHKRHLAAAVLAVCATPVLMLVHLMAIGIFGLIIAGATLIEEKRKRSSWVAGVRLTILRCGPAGWPFLLLPLLERHSAPSTGWLDFKVRAIWLVTVLRSDHLLIDIPSNLFLYAVPFAPLLLRRRGYGYDVRLLSPALLVGIFALVAPTALMGSSFGAVRMIPIALALAILAVRPPPGDERLLLGLALTFVAIRLISVAVELRRYDAVAQDQLRALDAIPRGSRILAFSTLQCERSWRWPHSQDIQALATPLRDAFVNAHYVEVESQLLAVTYPAARPYARQPSNIIMSRPCPRWSRPDLAQTMRNAPIDAFDYIWVIGPPSVISGYPRITLIWHSSDAVVYRIGPAT